MLLGHDFVALLQTPGTSVRVDRKHGHSIMLAELFTSAETPMDAGEVPHVIRLEFEKQAVYVGDGWNPEREQWREPRPDEVAREITLPAGAELTRVSIAPGDVWRIHTDDATFTFHIGRRAIDFNRLQPARRSPLYRGHGPLASEL